MKRNVKRQSGRKKEFCLAFRQNLRIFRIKAGMSQEDLANAIGLGQPVISSYEYGRCEPPLLTVVQLAKALNVEDIGEFFIPPSKKDINEFLSDMDYD